MFSKRDFVTGTLLAASGAAALAQMPAAPTNGLGPARAIPHGMMKTTRMFKYPPGYGNGLAVAPEGCGSRSRNSRATRPSDTACPNPPTSARPPGCWTGTANC